MGRRPIHSFRERYFFTGGAGEKNDFIFFRFLRKTELCEASQKTFCSLSGAVWEDRTAPYSIKQSPLFDGIGMLFGCR